MANFDFYYPFDSVSSDRQVTAATERRYFSALFTDGAVGSDAFTLNTTGTGVYSIGTGVCCIAGAIGGIVNAKSMTVRPSMGASLYIVCRLDTRSAQRKISLEAVSSMADATIEQLESGGQRDLVLYRVQNNSGTYETTDLRVYCTSFDNAHYDALYQAALQEMQTAAQAELETLQANYDAAIAEANTENAGLYGAAGRQGFMNPTFTVAQRGDGAPWQQSQGTVQTVDRWAVRIGGRTTSTPIVTSRWQDGARNSLQIANKTYSSGTTPGATCLLQNIEDGVRTFCSGGKQFTVSFDAKSTASQRIAVEPVQFAATGGQGITIQAQSVSVTTSWRRYSITFTGNLDVTAEQAENVLKIGFFIAWTGYTERFGAAQNAANTVSFANMQINEGNAALPCYSRPYGDELEACQRYYVALGSTNLSTGAQNANTRRLTTSTLPLTRQMRTTPTAMLYDRAGTAGCASVETSAGTWKNGLAAVRSSNSTVFPVFVVTNNNNDAISRVEFSKIVLDAELTD